MVAFFDAECLSQDYARTAQDWRWIGVIITVAQRDGHRQEEMVGQWKRERGAGEEMIRFELH